jgi:23S rRNA pseudouridine2605 synthase
MDQVRIHKFLAQAGVASRREVEKMVAAGRITVDGEVATVGQKIDPSKAEIFIDGTPLQKNERKIYIAFHKPPGFLSSTRSQGNQPTIFDLIQVEERIYPAGRLDLESEGLMLLSNDGDLTQHLTHPRYGHEKEYLVQLDEKPGEKTFASWRKGPTLTTGEKLAPVQIKESKMEKGHVWLRLVMKEGKKRQIRRTAAHFGYAVLRLIRTRIGPIEIGDLQPGTWRYLTEKEVADLRPN